MRKKKLTKKQIIAGLEKLATLKAKDVPKERREIFKILKKPMQDLAKHMLKDPEKWTKKR